MPIARAVSAKFKAFLFPVIESYSVVPVFRSSVIPRFPVSLAQQGWWVYLAGREEGCRHTLGKALAASLFAAGHAPTPPLAALIHLHFL